MLTFVNWEHLVNSVGSVMQVALQVAYASHRGAAASHWTRCQLSVMLLKSSGEFINSIGWLVSTPALPPQ